MKIVNGWKEDDTDLGVEWIYGSVGPGWKDILTRLIEDLETLGWNGQILQVKEKFGGLRFYINGGPKGVHERIVQAERESYDVCERCGQPGKLRPIDWWKTLCDEHAKAEEKDGSVYPDLETDDEDCC